MRRPWKQAGLRLGDLEVRLDCLAGNAERAAEYADVVAVYRNWLQAVRQACDEELAALDGPPKKVEG